MGQEKLQIKCEFDEAALAEIGFGLTKYFRFWYNSRRLKNWQDGEVA